MGVSGFHRYHEAVCLDTLMRHGQQLDAWGPHEPDPGERRPRSVRALRLKGVHLSQRAPPFDLTAGMGDGQPRDPQGCVHALDLRLG
ncbi:hypothetical protein BJM39_25475 [Salmonella enterica subsp. enterica serovar Javiana]|nr:hypothetical protein BJM39_25475 [Salmonella enterica subsp. enterica serovar Javiana]